MKKIIALVLALAAICTMSFAQVSAGNETAVNSGLPADYVLDTALIPMLMFRE